MRLSRTAARSVLILALVVGTARAAAPQDSTVTAGEVQRLQSVIDDVAREVARARGRDAALASTLQSELDDVRDDATYLKVKARRQEPIGRREVDDLRGRLESIRSRALGEVSTDRRDDRVRDAAPGEIPVGTEFDVRLQSPLSSATAQPEDRFEATTVVDLRQGDGILVPAGSLMRGIVRSVTKATRTERKGSLTVDFDRITIHGRSLTIRATVTQAIESEGVMGEKEKIGAGAGVGAIIGGILGGVKGALAGILVGGGGMIAATPGDDVQLQPGSVLRVRLDAPLDVRH